MLSVKGIKKHATNCFIHYSVASVCYLRGSEKIIKHKSRMYPAFFLSILSEALKSILKRFSYGTYVYTHLIYKLILAVFLGEIKLYKNNSIPGTEKNNQRCSQDLNLQYFTIR